MEIIYRLEHGFIHHLKMGGGPCDFSFQKILLQAIYKSPLINNSETEMNTEF